MSFSAWWYWQLAWSGRAASRSCLHGCKLKLDYFVVVESRLCESSVFPAIVSQRMALCQLFSAVAAHVGGGSRRDSTRFFASVKPKSSLCYSKDNIYSIFFLPSGPPQDTATGEINFCDTFLCASSLNIDGMCWICKKDWADWEINQKKTVDC